MSEVIAQNPTTQAAAAMDNANATTTAAAEEEPLFYGRWKAEEERYAEMIIQEFRAGNLDIEEGTTLRGYLANVLNCAPKRISKKFESSGYNGRQQYIRKPANFTAEESKKRLDDLEVARQEFETRRKGLAAKKPKKGSVKSSSSPKTTAFLKKKAAAATDKGPTSTTGATTAEARDVAAPTRPQMLSNFMGQGGFNPAGGAHGLSFLRGATSRTGLPSPSLDPLASSLSGAMYPGRMNYADALLLARSNPALGLSSPSLGSSSSYFSASRAGASSMGSVSDAALLETMLMNSSNGPSLSIAGFPTSRDILSAELMQRRIDAAHMARRGFEQRYLMQQITSRKRFLEEQSSRTAGTGAGGVDPQGDDTPASKRARLDDA